MSPPSRASRSIRCLRLFDQATEKTLATGGRALTAFTHVDERYQAYFTAYLVVNRRSVSLKPSNTSQAQAKIEMTTIVTQALK